jgi:V8-like Glu-specific endopeptidase
MPREGHRSLRSEVSALEAAPAPAPPPPPYTKVALASYRNISEIRELQPARRRPQGIPEGVARLESAEPMMPASGPPAADVSIASFGNTNVLEVVIGTDDRARVPGADLKRNPWRQICALRIKSRSNKNYVGTGWFIGPKTLATAGHCVFLHLDGGWAKSIEVIPALNGGSRPHGQVFSNQFRAVDGWVNDKRQSSDYGVIQLTDDTLGRKLGWFEVVAETDDNLRQTIGNISGYPADLDQASRQYFHARRLVDVSSQLLNYDIDTFGGQSGSPIFHDTGSEIFAVGVHTTGSAVGNSGTRITEEVLDNLATWAEE